MTDTYDIPANMMTHLDAYIEHGTPMGGFLSAVVSNDLKDAVFRADRENLPRLAAYVQYLHWEAPPGCHGSEKKMEGWIASRAALAVLATTHNGA